MYVYVYVYKCIYIYVYVYIYVYICIHTLCMRAFDLPPCAPPISMLTSDAPRPREKRPLLTKKSSRDINIEIGGRGGELVSVHVCTYT